MSESDGRLWADSYGYYYFETSANNDTGINEAFEVFFILQLLKYLNDIFCKVSYIVLIMIWYTRIWQTLVKSVVTTVTTGSRPTSGSSLHYTHEQAELVAKIKACRDNYERLGVQAGASKSVFIIRNVNRSKR